MAQRYRFVLLEDPGVTLPVPYQPPAPQPVWVRAPDPLDLLVAALYRLSWRGEGEEPWAPALAEDPLAFLLDAIGDAVILREQGGRLMYANPAARRLRLPEQALERELELLELEDARYERRCMTFQHGAARLVLEVLRRVA